MLRWLPALAWCCCLLPDEGPMCGRLLQVRGRAALLAAGLTSNAECTRALEDARPALCILDGTNSPGPETDFHDDSEFRIFAEIR